MPEFAIYIPSTMKRLKFFWEGSISLKIFTNQYFKIDQQIHKILINYSMQFDIVYSEKSEFTKSKHMFYHGHQNMYLSHCVLMTMREHVFTFSEHTFS